MMICVGGFIASAISDHYSRKTIMLIGVAGLTFFTLLLTLVQTAEQLIIVRLLTGLAGGFAVFAPFPIAAELMPARHRRTFSAVYEMALACSFAVLPLVGRLLADSPNAFRLMALPGGLAFFVMPALIYFLIPESPRWHLRRGHADTAVDIVNRIIRGAGSRVPPLWWRPSAAICRPRAKSCRPTGHCSIAANCAGRQSGFRAMYLPELGFF
jgi:putative MFS transporter